MKKKSKQSVFLIGLLIILMIFIFTISNINSNTIKNTLESKNSQCPEGAVFSCPYGFMVINSSNSSKTSLSYYNQKNCTGKEFVLEVNEPFRPDERKVCKRNVIFNKTNITSSASAEENCYNFRNSVIRYNLSEVKEGTCTECNSNTDCSSGFFCNTIYHKCIKSIEMSAATLKDIYKVDEIIQLTDPQEDLDYNQEYLSDNYLIEFDGEPLIDKYLELKDKKTKSSLNSQISNHKEELIFQHKEIKSKMFNNNLKIKKNNPNKNIKEFYNSFNGIALTLSSEEVEEIKKIKGVKNIYPDLEITTFLTDSVSLIEADKVWQQDLNGDNCLESGKECLTGKGITIAIIDTGVDYTHPDLGGCLGEDCKVIRGYDFVNNDFDPIDDNGHGTHIAGITSGNGVLKGVAPDSKIYAYKITDSKGVGQSSNILSAIEMSIDPNQDNNFSDHVDIMSISAGAKCTIYEKWCGPDDIISQSIDKATKLGIVSVIAAGNNGSSENTINTPGTSRTAITIGASDQLDNIAIFSSRGPVIWKKDNSKLVLTKPDIIAPGVSICSAGRFFISNEKDIFPEIKCIDNQHIYLSGTSIATPFVSGAVALLKQKHPEFTPQEIKIALKTTALNIGENPNTFGDGRINIYDAINLKEITQIKGCYDCERPQSMILNNLNQNINGVVSFKIQVYEKEKWKKYRDLRTRTSKVNLPEHIPFTAPQPIKLDEIFNKYKMSVSDSGKYRVLVELRQGNKKIEETSWEFYVVK